MGARHLVDLVITYKNVKLQEYNEASYMEDVCMMLDELL